MGENRGLREACDPGGSFGSTARHQPASLIGRLCYIICPIYLDRVVEPCAWQSHPWPTDITLLGEDQRRSNATENSIEIATAGVEYRNIATAGRTEPDRQRAPQRIPARDHHWAVVQPGRCGEPPGEVAYTKSQIGIANYTPTIVKRGGRGGGRLDQPCKRGSFNPHRPVGSRYADKQYRNCNYGNKRP